MRGICNTNLELLSKRQGMKTAFSVKIMTISCRIDLSDRNHLSNNLIFRPFYRMVVRLVLNKYSISLIWPLQVLGYCCRKMFMYPLQLILCILLPKKRDVSQSLNSV